MAISNTSRYDLPRAYRSSVHLEAALGNPLDPASKISFEKTVERDEREEAPLESFDAIQSWGFNSYLVPTGYRGKLTSFEELLSLVRTISRRDVVVTIGRGSSLLAAIPVWIWGTEEQGESVAQSITTGAFGAMALSEDRAGSDLPATRTQAVPLVDGFVLNGEKWLIGNGTRSTFVTLLAQSDPFLSLFFLVKSRLEVGTVRYLPKVSTLGLRGHDLSGIVFEDCRIPDYALLGHRGRGLEMVLKTFQVTRTLISGLCLGAADTGLHIALHWARERMLYGNAILALAPIQDLLVSSFVELLIAECVAISSARALTVASERMSLWSSIAKYIVPLLCEDIMRDTASVLSARFYLRQNVASGIFQKMARDIAIAGIFEGTQMVQLASIASQLRSLCGRTAEISHNEADRVDLESLFSLARETPVWDPKLQALRLSNHGRNEIVQAWERSIEIFESEMARSQEESGVTDRIRQLVNAFLEVRRGLTEAVRSISGDASRLRVDGYRLARQYCVLHAAASPPPR